MQKSQITESAVSRSPIRRRPIVKNMVHAVTRLRLPYICTMINRYYVQHQKRQSEAEVCLLTEASTDSSNRHPQSQCGTRGNK
jgi:hypothetical protein